MTGFAPSHAPSRQVSVCVHASPSSQTTPSGLAGSEQIPVSESQGPASWHWSSAVQVTGFAPLHAPPWHVSVCVQALPSVQGVPFDLGCGTHWSVVSLQTPTLHWLPALEQSRGVPWHAPPPHTSFTVQN